MDKHKENEIDLLELFIKIYLILKKYWWIFLISVIVGIAAAFVQSVNSADSYKSSMIISVKPENDYMYAFTFREFNKRYEKNPAELIVEIINQANELIENDNIGRLAKKMNFNEKQLQGLKTISSEHKTKKGEAPAEIVKINVVSTNKKIFNNLGKGLEFLINNNAYVKTRNYEDSLMLLKMITQIDIKSKELDSLQTKFLKNGKINDFFIFKQGSFFGESVMLSSLKEKLNNEIHNLKQVKVIEDFYIPKASKKSFSKKALTYVLLLFILSVIIIIIIIFNKKAKQYQYLKK